jgi:type IV pilus assembly protein PilA
MLARIRKSMDEKDKGFTLIELLVVMIIIGILAAIAIPVFLNQRKKAVDTAAKADVSTIGKEVATWYVDGDPAVEVPVGGGDGSPYTVNSESIGDSSDKLGVPTIEFSGTDKSISWCVELPIDTDAGTLTAVSYSADQGLQPTAC